MKKSKLLIPALSVASVGAVVAPMVTSCAQACEITFQSIKNGAWQKYENKVTAIDKATYKNQVELANAYANAVNGNKTILADDLMSSYISIMKTQTPEPRAKTEEVTVKIHNIENKNTVTFSTNPVITSYITADVTVKQTFGKDKETILTYSFVSVPYSMWFNGGSVIEAVTTPILIPAFLSLLGNDESAAQQATLAFAATNFSINIALKDFNKEAVFADFACDVHDLAGLNVLVQLAKSETFKEYLGVFELPAISNYFKKVKQSQ